MCMRGELKDSHFPAPVLHVPIAKRQRRPILVTTARHVHPGVVRRVTHRQLAIINRVLILVYEDKHATGSRVDDLCEANLGRS